jgi:hypothetical protein
MLLIKEMKQTELEALVKELKAVPVAVAELVAVVVMLVLEQM